MGGHLVGVTPTNPNTTPAQSGPAETLLVDCTSRIEADCTFPRPGDKRCYVVTIAPPFTCSTSPVAKEESSLAR